MIREFLALIYVLFESNSFVGFAEIIIIVVVGGRQQQGCSGNVNFGVVLFSWVV